MVHQSKASQSSQISDDTPMLTGSNSVSSLNETPPLSPFDSKFLHQSHPSSTQQIALPDILHDHLENSHEAWWSRSTGRYSSNSPCAVGSGPQKEPVKRLLLANYDCPRPTAYSVSLLDGTSETEEDVPFDAYTEKSDISFHTAESTNRVLTLEPQEEEISDLPTEDQQPLMPLQLKWDADLAQPPLVDVSVTPPSPEMGLAIARSNSLPNFAQSLLGPISTNYLLDSESHFDSYLYEPSRPNSSILAHCDQHSLSPPCETLTQTHSGRSTLREAGIPCGSPRALALPLPLENIPDKGTRSLAPNFLQKLVRKTFTKPSPATIRRASYPSFAATSSGPPTRDQSMRRSRLSRYSTSFASTCAQPLTPERKSAQSPPKKSRWWIVQRFITKPDTAARGIADDMRTQYGSDADSIGRGAHGLANGRSSCLSFFGDPMSRVDPFARAGGLGATVSDRDSPERPFASTGGNFEREI